MNARTRQQRQRAADLAITAAIERAVEIFREDVPRVVDYDEYGRGVWANYDATADYAPEDRRRERAWDVLYTAGTTAELLMGGGS